MDVLIVISEHVCVCQYSVFFEQSRQDEYAQAEHSAVKMGCEKLTQAHRVVPVAFVLNKACMD